MDCCQSESIGSHFDHKKAVKKLKQYRKKGSQKTTRVLTGALEAEGISGMTLLDIGGGIGAIQHELIKRGISSSVNLEASEAYIEACRKEAERQGHAARITHLQGDIVQMEAVPEADIVTLERVICCYPDMPELISKSCEKTKKLLGLVFPHEAWWVKLSMEIIYNFKFVLKGDPFRVFLHPTKDVHALVESYGFERSFYRKVGPWQVVVYGKGNGSGCTR